MPSPHSAPIATFSLLALLAGARLATAQVVFTTGFESGLPAALSAPSATIEGVQGFAGLGPAERRFQGSFLRYSAATVQPVTLTLSGLPPHTSVSLAFLLAVIDMWNGVENFQVRVDGQLLFSHSFYLNSSSYAPPAGAWQTVGTNLGFNPTYNDRAHDLGSDPLLHFIPHTAPGLTVEFTVSAPPGTWHGGLDESWAIDALTVTVQNSTAATYGAGCGQPALGIAPAPNSLPVIGSSQVTLVANGNGYALMALGFSSTLAGGLPLPLPLASIGMPGCDLLIDPTILSQPVMSTATGMQYVLPIPNNPRLSGLQVFLQAWRPQPGANAAGLVVSNGVRLTIG